MSIFTDHPRDTDNPQTYFQHMWFAFKNCFVLQIALFAGIVHGLCPWWFKFYTSTKIIQCFKGLVDSGRHKGEILEIMPEGYINPACLEFKRKK